MVRAVSVFAFGGLEIALEGIAFVLVHTLGQVGKLLVFTARNDVGANAIVTTVALNASLIRIVVLQVLVNDVAIFQLGEVVATLTGTCGLRARPGTIGLAQENRESGTLISGVTLVPGRKQIELW